MAVIPSVHEKNVYMAKLAKLAQWDEEMVEFMEKVSVVVESEELTMVYKNVIDTKWALWRIISSIK